MLNPAGVKHQLIGVSDISKAPLIGHALLTTGSKRIMVVQGDEGVDEISVEKDTHVVDFDSEKEVEKYDINPKDYGLEIYSLEEIKGGEREENKNIFLNILKNQATPAQINAVLLNSAAGMLVFGKVRSMEDGVELAREMIESGKALKKLEEFLK